MNSHDIYRFPLYRRAFDGTLTFIGKTLVTGRLASACADRATRLAGDQHRIVYAFALHEPPQSIFDLHVVDAPGTLLPPLVFAVMIPHHVLFEHGVLRFEPERDAGDHYDRKRELAAMLHERLSLMADGLSEKDRKRLQLELGAAEYVGD